ncbi:Acetyltransferase (GNAT) family protein [Maioricimonas rarisocia]|uniref:Acetyltransferase (GNAT) family protein n=1 Tax=Maioricimonas rarisocia TaxID=2528026 RepID=A0A517YZR9_9PLAN|nr:GNAT family N-acetyltransferase [Maioricimonas rarisocia]QDU35746.1 Acetyltransferase (GNAT) family protein [Maioricimonas rarisocia]
MSTRQTESGCEFRPARPDDFAAVLALNEAAVPHVNSIGEDVLARLAEQAFHFEVAVAKEIAGFVLALPSGVEYASENYRWFSARYDRFVYVDRVVVAEPSIGTGIGRQLYERLMARSVENAPVLTCEVNLHPPNPRSLAFHRRLGFEEVGQQLTTGGTKRVCMLSRRLDGE